MTDKERLRTLLADLRCLQEMGLIQDGFSYDDVTDTYSPAVVTGKGDTQLGLAAHGKGVLGEE